jgi:hypothetical protein
MKKVYLSVLVCVLFALQLTAQVITVSNNVNTPGQYDNLTNAIFAANPGDTIYVHGSSTNYGAITVNKKLTFIGPGYNPNSQFNLTASISAITLDSIIPTSGSSGSKFIGLNIGHVIKVTPVLWTINDILFERCRFTGSVKTNVIGPNWVFRNNLFLWTTANAGLDIDFHSNLVITNNFFSFGPQATSTTQAIYNSNKSSVIINNNIFTGFHQGSSFDNISNAQFSNNIFFGKSPQGATSSIFENNLTFANQNTALPYGSNTGQNNIVNQDPVFANIPVNTFTFNYAYNFQLQPTSPGKNAGADGTDIGIFGGVFPMPTNQDILTGESRLPQIYYMNIQNNVIDQNTPINVTVRARRDELIFFKPFMQ